jgi:hypothetical protein
MNCLFEDNNGAKKYQRLRNLNYILGGCLIFSSAAFIGSNIVKERVPIFGLPPQLSYVPIFLVVTYGLFCNENNIFVSMESITTPAM